MVYAFTIQLPLSVCISATVLQRYPLAFVYVFFSFYSLVITFISEFSRAFLNLFLHARLFTPFGFTYFLFIFAYEQIVCAKSFVDNAG